MGGVNREPGPPPVEVSVEVAASAAAVYDLVADVRRMGEWSPECVRCEWLGGDRDATVGARFRGHNRNGMRRWSTVSTVIAADPGQAFAFRTRSLGLPVSEWRYGVEPTPGGCRLTETWSDARGGLMRTLGRLATGVVDRASHNRAGMEATLSRIKAAAEAAAPVA